MFEQNFGRSGLVYAAGLAVLSLVALFVTMVILRDVSREQEIVSKLIQHLPESDLAAAEELSGDLSLQSSLSLLLVVNILLTVIASGFVIRGYLSSEKSLRDVKVLSTDILASMDAGVITTDTSGRVTSVNPRGLVLVGPQNVSVNRSLSEIEKEHSLLYEICKEVSVRDNCIRDRDYIVLHQGHQRTLRAGCTLLRNQRNEKIGTVIHVRDVSQKALIEERLRRMERYMGLGSLAAGLQHEIKNPLSALSLHVQLLHERLGEQPERSEVKENLDVLQSEIRRISRVLDGFRSYASMGELGRSQVDVVELIQKLLRLLRPQAESQGVGVSVQIVNGFSGRVQGDSGQLEQVLLNLALNALAAMPHGGQLIFKVDSHEGFARIVVSDTGHGIPEEIQSQIFDPYFTTRNDGTGMGLALCEKIIRQHEGTIEFRSSNRGTQFTVRLPLEEMK
jgi:signal transduction histidine kinase